MTNRDKVLRCFPTTLALLVALLSMNLVLVAQESAEQSTQAPPAAGQEFEGTVKIGLGKYFYLPSAKGFDIVVQGSIEGQDASFLTGKEVRVRGELFGGESSVLVANTIELKEGTQYRTIFTRTEPVTMEDHLDLAKRAQFPVLTIKGYDKNKDWEGKGKVKIYGKIDKTEVGGSEKYNIIVYDEKGKEIGKILVDSVSDYARYYIKKLRLFDRFWCYIEVKDTVDWRTRRKTRELFHADLLFAGLF